MKLRRFDLEKDKRERLVQRLEAMLRKHGEVVFAYIYGSFTEGLPFHDIDVGVYISEITKEESTNYSLDLSQGLSRELKIPVDVRVLNFAPVLFLYHVIQGTLVLERDEEKRVQVVEKTIQRYLDLKPIIREGIKEAFSP
ncbi:MAG: nucleotidyltransferase domain-containing protein [Syntrophaceae bacterium]|nr:nucleotidyltransferase domain-containing protein [Syntrophaceae bacterium]